MTSASATLILLNDAIPEGNETFVVQITSTRLGAEIGRQNTLILVVRANDEPYGQFQFDQVRRSTVTCPLPLLHSFCFSLPCSLLMLPPSLNPTGFLPSFILSLPPSHSSISLYPSLPPSHPSILSLSLSPSILSPSIPSFYPLPVPLSLHPILLSSLCPSLPRSSLPPSHPSILSLSLSPSIPSFYPLSVPLSLDPSSLNPLSLFPPLLLPSQSSLATIVSEPLTSGTAINLTVTRGPGVFGRVTVDFEASKDISFFLS